MCVVLTLFEIRARHAAGIGVDIGHHDDATIIQDIVCCRGEGAIRAFDDVLGRQRFRFTNVDCTTECAWHGDVRRECEHVRRSLHATRNHFAYSCVHHAANPALGCAHQCGDVETLLTGNDPADVGDSHDARAPSGCELCCPHSDVAETLNHDSLAFKRRASRLTHE